MKVLVMGGSYFIGWHLVNNLVRSGHEVVVFNRGTKDRDYPGTVRHIKGDRNNYVELATALSDEKVDAVYDLSAFRGEQTEPLVEVFDNKIRHFIHVSTSAVYLDSSILPIKEDFPVGEHHVWGAYGSAKLECEQILFKKFSETGFPVTVIRPSYVYGPENYIARERFLYERISRNRPILIPGDGKALLQLGHVYDLVHAMISLLGKEKVLGEAYHVSADEYITLNGLTYLVGDIMGHEVNIVNVDPSLYGYKDRDIFPFDNCTYFTSIDKIRDAIGWKPAYSLRRGFEEGYRIWLNDSDKVKPDFSNEDDVLSKL